MDKISAKKRSRNMRNIRSKNTKPEILLRKLIFNAGYRYRVHVTDIPGKPDLVFKSKKKVIFMHGCFWHQHEKKECRLTHKPKSNTKFWKEKFIKNKSRDRKNIKDLQALNWDILTVWECELENHETLLKIINDFLTTSYNVST